MEVLIKSKYIGDTYVYLDGETEPSFRVRNTNPITTRCVVYDKDNHKVAHTRKNWLKLKHYHSVFIQGVHKYDVEIGNLMGATIYDPDGKVLFTQKEALNLYTESGSQCAKAKYFKSGFFSMYQIDATLSPEIDIILYAIFCLMNRVLNSYAPQGHYT